MSEHHCSVSQRPNLHAHLQISVQCTIQNPPHLLGTDIMHQLPLDWDVTHGQEWNSPLTAVTDSIIRTFLVSLVGHKSIPKCALIVSQLSVDMGGIGTMYPSHRVALDFVLTLVAMM